MDRGCITVYGDLPRMNLAEISSPHLDHVVPVAFLSAPGTENKDFRPWGCKAKCNNSQYRDSLSEPVYDLPEQSEMHSLFGFCM
jgi:hypothetical protein